MIEYKLEKNELTADPNDYRAVVVNTRVFSAEDVINRMLASGAGLTLSDIRAVDEARKQASISIVAEGGVPSDGLYTMTFTMPGKYSPLEEPEQHTIEIHLHPCRELREAAARLKVRRVVSSGNEPVISAVQDVNSRGIDTVTSGGVFIIKGQKIKVAGAHPDAGLYLKNLSTGAITKFTGNFAENTPSKLMLQAPTLPAGAYRLTIKTQFSGSGGREMAQPRLIEYANDITVI